MDGSKKVWVPHPTDGYIKGRISDIGSDTITVDTDEGKSVVAPYDKVFPTEEYEKDVEDNCALMYLNEATLLHNMRLRYKKNCIYTYVANILIAINPYCEIPELYSKGTSDKYRGKSLGVMPPHVFAIADKSYRDMKALKSSQSIIVSGESGAGKTETTKYILKYLTECYGAHAGPIEQRIVESNPLLEAFGNAKTVRNNNSSRFGKFVEIHFDSRSLVAGGYISHYLLEKSRICLQSSEERNYHIFYRICAGAPKDMRDKLGLISPDQFNYLRQGNTQFFVNPDNERKLSTEQKSQMEPYLKSGSLRDIQLDDVRDFARTDKAMSDMGLSAQDKLDIYLVVAAVLHLGNIEFEDSQGTQGGCQVSAASKSSLQKAAELLGVPADQLQDSLTIRTTQAARGGAQDSKIRIALRPEEASNARDALAKAVYAKLFDNIVLRVNQALPFTSSMSYIGVLDIAGFEYFQKNSFEQFCINYCNEKLQQFFNERVLKEEQVLYEKEGLGVKKIDYVDNQDCIDLIETKSIGIFDVLDEESKLPKPSSAHFTTQVFSQNKNHFRIMLPRKSKLKVHREVRDDEGFLIRHFAGAVCYHTDQFIDKNNDALHASLEELVQKSSFKLIQTLFAIDQNNAPRKPGAGKLNFDSVGSKFRIQLGKLMEKLRSTGTNFIRCIKPNLKMVDHLFEGANILTQLQCAGMTYVLDLMQQGYPSRAKFDDLYNMYKKFLPPDLSRLDPRLFCKLLFKVLGLDDNDFKFGITKVFFRPGKFAEFDQMLKADPENLAMLVKKVKKWLIHYRWRKAQYCTWEVIKLKNKIIWRRSMLIKVQKTMRMWICVKIFRPKIQGLMKLQHLRKQIPNLTNIANQLKKDRDSAMKLVSQITADIESTATRLRTNPRSKIPQSQIDSMLSTLFALQDKCMAELKKKVDAEKQREEQERLRKIQEAMEEEKRLKAEEERKRKEEEEEKRKRAEIEERRRQEVAEAKRREEEDQKAAALLQKQLNEERSREIENSRNLEQERMDRELALRLANEDQNGVEDVSAGGTSLPQLQRGAIVMAQRNAQKNKKYDLTKWKYADLRDTINTSCDVELLTACREEFHRRLKVYHDWKQKNKNKTESTSGADNVERAPQAVLDNATSDQAMLSTMRGSPKGGSAPSKKDISSQQRFFSIPFNRPNERGSRASVTEGGGTWWAHFDGKYIVRQMEVLPDKPGRLLLAGIDDFEMLEVTLEETGLTKKKGAEITESQFEKEWQKHDGERYIRMNYKKIASQYLKQKFK